MFVQMISMRAPTGEIKSLRSLIAHEYLPAVRARPGFVAAHLLEKVDDRDCAELMIFWDSQSAVEEANRTTALAGSDHSIAARMPGLRIQRQSYIVKVAVDTPEHTAV
jgi:heme-degrading monooxygenase HmoA